MGKLIYSMICPWTVTWKTSTAASAAVLPRTRRCYAYVNQLASSVGTDLYGGCYETMVY